MRNISELRLLVRRFVEFVNGLSLYDKEYPITMKCRHLKSFNLEIDVFKILCPSQVIRRDIARTYPEHDFFKEKDGLGQESLFNVMKAYSLHDREVGYCQGSAFIVGLLLMQVSLVVFQILYAYILFSDYYLFSLRIIFITKAKVVVLKQ